MIVRTPEDYQAFRITPDDSNRLVLVFDPIRDQANFVFAVEIFDVGGKTPPNTHLVGHEMFFVLSGRGIARRGETEIDLAPGDALYLPPGTPHEIVNIGPQRLYCLTFMTPDESFAALIRNGVPVELDAEDMTVLGRLPGQEQR